MDIVDDPIVKEMIEFFEHQGYEWDTDYLFCGETNRGFEPRELMSALGIASLRSERDALKAKCDAWEARAESAWKKMDEFGSSSLKATLDLRDVVAERDALRDALTPFAAAVYNDNGDVTVTYSGIGIEHWFLAYRLVRGSLLSSTGKET